MYKDIGINFDVQLGYQVSFVDDLDFRWMDILNQGLVGDEVGKVRLVIRFLCRVIDILVISVLEYI